jgi:hypothetical protein
VSRPEVYDEKILAGMDYEEEKSAVKPTAFEI